MSQFWKTVLLESMDIIDELEETTQRQSEMILELQKRIDQNSAAVESESKTSVNDIVAGAIFDLMGMLTTRQEPLTLSLVHHSSPAVDAIREFAKLRGLNLDSPDIMSWNEKL